MKYTHITLDVGVAIKEFSCAVESTRKLVKNIVNLGRIHPVMDFLVQSDHIHLGGAQWRKLYIS